MDLITLLAHVKDPPLRAKLSGTLSKRGGKLTPSNVLNDPYLLLEVGGWTFPLVDKVAEACDIPKATRARRIVIHAVKTHLQQKGDSIMSSNELKGVITKLGWDRRAGKASISVTNPERLTAYLDMLEEGEELLLAGQGTVVWSNCLRQERSIWKVACQEPWLEDRSAEATVVLETSYNHLDLSSEQQAAVAQAFGSHKVSLVTGHPGCGKSACCDAIAQVARELGMCCHFVAFTWLAAQRIGQVSRNNIKATSIHRFVYTLMARYRKGDISFDKVDEAMWFDKDVPEHDDTADWPYLDLLVLDEASMASVSIMHMLLSVLPGGCRLALVGDDGQLSPIGFGQPFADLVEARRRGCEAMTAPMVELTRVFRTEQPHIVDFAKACRRGEKPEWMQGPGGATFEDFAWIDDADTAVILQDLRKFLSQSNQDPEAFQIIVAGKQGPVGMWALNALAASILRPAGSSHSYMVDQAVMCVNEDGPVALGTMGVVVRKKDMRVKWRGGTTDVGEDFGCIAPAFVVGDKVMWTSSGNDKVRNGERGFVVAINKKAIRVEYSSKSSLWHNPSEQEHLQLAYAITTHKFQGNEVNHVLVVVDPSHGIPLLTRKLLYTATTRGKHRLTLYCASATLDRCLQCVASRSTCLAALLEGKHFE